MLKKILLALFALLLALQLVRPAKNLALADSPDDILHKHPAPPEAAALLRTACYDCHSATTRYPWYAEIQPLGWWLAHHVKDGKRHLNFSEFAAYAPDRAARKLRQTIEVIEEHEMPLPSYALIHRDARLTDAQRKTLTDYFATLRPAYPGPKPKN